SDLASRAFDQTPFLSIKIPPLLPAQPRVQCVLASHPRRQASAGPAPGVGRKCPPRGIAQVHGQSLLIPFGVQLVLPENRRRACIDSVKNGFPFLSRLLLEPPFKGN